MACSDKAGTADKVQAAAGKLADLQAHVAERARVLTAAQMAVMAPVLEEQARLAGEIAALKGGPRSLSGDVILRCMGNGCGDVPHRQGPSPEAGPAWRCSECGEPRSGPHEPEGVKVGDTFMRMTGVAVGEIGEVTKLGDAYVSGHANIEGWWDLDALLGGEHWTPVRAVEAPAYEPDGNERLATAEELAVPAATTPITGAELLASAPPGFAAAWGGMEPEDSGVDDLDGPAGDERAGGLTDAAQALADMTADVQALVKAWDAFDVVEATAPMTVALDSAINALARRAGLL